MISKILVTGHTSMNSELLVKAPQNKNVIIFVITGGKRLSFIKWRVGTVSNIHTCSLTQGKKKLFTDIQLE